MANGLITSAQFPGLNPDFTSGLARTVQTAGAISNLQFQKEERERLKRARDLQGKILQRLDKNDPRLAELASASPELFTQVRNQLGLISQDRLEEAADFAFDLQNTPSDQRMPKIERRVQKLLSQNRDPSNTMQLAQMLPEEQDEALKVAQLLPLSAAQRSTLQSKISSSKIAQDKLKIQERNQELRELEQQQVTETNELRREELTLKIQQRRDDIEQAERAEKLTREQQLEQASNIISKADKSLNKLGFFNTGFIGGITKRIPGTSAHALDKTLDVIRANLGFAELLKMRQASKTGGALGQVTVREIELLQSTLDSLNIGLKDEQLAESLTFIRDSYSRIRNNLIRIQAGETELDEELSDDEKSELETLRRRFKDANR